MGKAIAPNPTTKQLNYCLDKIKYRRDHIEISRVYLRQYCFRKSHFIPNESDWSAHFCQVGCEMPFEPVYIVEQQFNRQPRALAIGVPVRANGLAAERQPARVALAI